jgi:hypothetical protein
MALLPKNGRIEEVNKAHFDGMSLASDCFYRSYLSFDLFVLTAGEGGFISRSIFKPKYISESGV